MSSSWDQPVSKELRMVEEEIMRNVRSSEPLLTEIATHVIGSGGKRMRPGVSLLAFRAVGGTDLSKIIMLSAAIELIHSATLVHDDINDGAEIRRGVIAACRKYGTQRALITGDFLFVKGFRLGGLAGSDDIVEIVADTCAGMAESEMLQSLVEYDHFLPLETYLQIIEGKTAKPIEASAQVGAYMGGGSADQVEEMSTYGLNIGCAFQIVDDILDITGEEDTLGKKRGMDILEGKPNLPLILAMRDDSPGSARIREVFGKQSKTQEEVDEVLHLIQATDALDEAMRYAESYREKALKGLDVLPDSEYKDALRALADTVLERNR
ncbi:MAG: polyprenyl synthetase family protein [Euryarchaeota archaeon]|nr:polyprenyl synthetase family protein [Euryarchaeota archaeon]